MMTHAVNLLDIVKGERNRYGLPVLDLQIKVMTDEGVEEIWPFTYLPEDTAPMTGMVKAWLAAHPDFEIAPAVVLRAVDLGLNRRNVRSVFIGLGYPADAVDIAIQNRPAGGEREELLLSWLEDDAFRFDSPVVVAAFDHWHSVDPNLTMEAFDARWLEIARLGFPTDAEPLIAPSEAVN